MFFLPNTADRNPTGRRFLRSAFKDELNLSEYLRRIGWTASLTGLIMCCQLAYHNGQIDLMSLYPADLHWHTCDAAGNFYVDTWSTVLVNSFRVALGIWGAWLLVLGAKRVLTAHKYFFGCFSLGLTFCCFAWALPLMSQPLLQVLVDKMPFLVNG